MYPSPGHPVPDAPDLRGFGLGTNGNGNGNGMPGWALPVGIGLVLGGLYMYFKKDKEPGSIYANMGDEPTCNSCGY